MMRQVFGSWISIGPFGPIDRDEEAERNKQVGGGTWNDFDWPDGHTN